MAKRGICSYCGLDVAMKKDGTLQKHGYGEADRRRRRDKTWAGCPGTGTVPRAMHQPRKKTGCGANSRRRIP